jgi:hypothetical protein
MYESNLYGELERFTGTKNYYNYNLNNIVFTDGVKYLADKADAYWLINTIASCQTNGIEKITFQAWGLTINSRKGVVLTMKEDNIFPRLVREDTGHYDFPIPTVDLWLINKVLMLPSEY